MKNRCAYCYGKFGLVRHRRGFKGFCSKACVDRHIVQLRAEFQKRLYSMAFSSPAIRSRAEEIDRFSIPSESSTRSGSA